MCLFVLLSSVCNSITLSTRGKGKKQDYRYVNMHDYVYSLRYYVVRFMAEPDLAPLVLTGKNTLLSGSEILTEAIVNVDKLQSELPELPMQTRSKLNTQYGMMFYMIMCIP